MFFSFAYLRGEMLSLSLLHKLRFFTLLWRSRKIYLNILLKNGHMKIQFFKIHCGWRKRRTKKESVKRASCSKVK